MIALLCSVVVLASSSCAGTVVNIDKEVDYTLRNMNNNNKFQKIYTLAVPEDTINGNVSYSKGYVTGWDSLQRTNTCTVTVYPSKTIVSYDLHVGLSFFVVTLGRVNFGHDDMNAYFQVEDNSLHLGVTVSKETNCTVSFYALRAESFQNVQFGVSNSDYKNFDFEGFFRSDVKEQVNRILARDSPKILNFFQHGLCSKSGLLTPIEIILAVMQDIFIGL